MEASFIIIHKSPYISWEAERYAMIAMATDSLSKQDFFI